MANARPGTAQAAADFARAVLGADPARAGGVIHVTATARADDGRLHVLAIGPHAPKSETDFFLLNLCRARADALLTTAANLRTEPALTHDLQGPWAQALARYRSETLAKTAPLCCAILTRTGDLPLAHPVWQDGTERLVLTEPAMTAVLEAKLGTRAQVIGLEGLSARSAVQWLERRGARTISVEAGPSTNAVLYEPPSLIEELLLSLCEVEALPAAALGKALPEDRRLFAGLRCAANSVRAEASGRWRFQRWLRDA